MTTPPDDIDAERDVGVAFLPAPVMALLRRTRAFVWRVLGVATRDHTLVMLEGLDRLMRMARQSAEASARSRQRQKVLERRVAELSERQRRVQNQLGGPTRGLEGAVRHIERNVNSLVRHHFVDQEALPFPHNVLSQRFHLWSQNEEDGITLALFKLVGTTNRRFVDIGAGGNGGNSGFLADVCGWTGVMVDASPDRVAKLAVRFGRFGVSTISEWVTRENINTLLERQDVTGDVDLFSIDIDGNDYWVWQALTACSPRVVIVEFNPFFGHTRSVVVRYDPRFDRGRYKAVCPYFYGASLSALSRLGSQNGYRLVLAEPRGANAYFLRADVGTSLSAYAPERVHPKPVPDVDRLFRLIEREGLPLVDLDKQAIAVDVGPTDGRPSSRDRSESA